MLLDDCRRAALMCLNSLLILLGWETETMEMEADSFVLNDDVSWGKGIDPYVWVFICSVLADISQVH